LQQSRKLRAAFGPPQRAAGPGCPFAALFKPFPRPYGAHPAPPS
jgi:hypothetical protein